ncbi:MAG: hypothetical protein IIB62_12410 [Proteobacteria bacterium]|nr:hypothetical protein [Pseudomonadota bacterium]
MTTEKYCTDFNLYPEGGLIEIEDAVYEIDYEYEQADSSTGERGGWMVSAELQSWMLGNKVLDRLFAVMITSEEEVEEQESIASMDYLACHLNGAPT